MVAYVEIGRNDQWRNLGSGQGRELSVVSASLRGVVVHSGLRYAFSFSKSMMVFISLLTEGCSLASHC